MKKLKTFDSSYFKGKNHCSEDGTQNYLIFQPMYRYLKNSNTDYVLLWKSKGKTIKHPTSSDNSLAPALSCYGIKKRVKSDGSCLKQDQITFTNGKRVNIYVVYEISASGSNSNDPTLRNCLFGVVRVTKNADVDKCGYSGYWIWFDKRGTFWFPGGRFDYNVIFF